MDGSASLRHRPDGSIWSARGKRYPARSVCVRLPVRVRTQTGTRTGMRRFFTSETLNPTEMNHEGHEDHEENGVVFFCASGFVGDFLFMDGLRWAESRKQFD